MQQNTKSRIVISGASGFIGSTLAQSFIALGHEVVGLVRQPENMQENGVKYVQYAFENTEIPDVFQDGDIFIHCAYSNTTTSNVQSIQATKALLHLARKNGVKQCVFLSSIAATSNSGSSYSLEKSTLENAFQTEGDIIVRPGLVIGKGGLFYNTFRFMKRRGILPVFGDGKQIVHYIAIENLVEIIHYLLQQKVTGTFYAVQEKPLSYLDFYTAVGQKTQRKIRIIKLPYWLILLGVNTIGKIVKLPITKDSIKGLQQIPQLDESLLKQSVYPFHLKSLSEILDDFQG